MIGDWSWHVRHSRRGQGIFTGIALLGMLALAASGAAQRPTAQAAEPSSRIDFAAGTATLPLQRGRMVDGAAVWYVLLDTSDADTAKRLAINWSAKLAHVGGAALREARRSPSGAMIFDAGAVDFAPAHKVLPGVGAPFPPQAAEPGSRGDDRYTPLFRDAATGIVFNAPVVAYGIEAEALDQFCSSAPDYARVHDKVVRICPRDGSVTLALTEGFSHGRRVVYVSTEASHPAVAALEGATFTPAFSDIDSGRDDAPDSAVEPIFVVVNGATGPADAARQGLTSALADGLPPRNILGDVPGLGHTYSPLWDSHPVLWSEAALAAGERGLLKDAMQVAGLALRGALSGPGGKPIAAEGVIVNCPFVARVP